MSELQQAIQPFDLPKEGPVFTFDTRLGEHFDRININEAAITGTLEAFAMDQADIADTTFHFSADVRESRDKEHVTDGTYSHDHKTITSYLGSIRSVSEEIQKEDPSFNVGWRISKVASANLVHEMAHRRNHVAFGEDALSAEKKQHERKHAAIRSIPAAVTMLGSIGLIGVAEYALTPLEIPLGYRIALGVAALVPAILLPIERMREKFEKVGIDYNVYRSRPEEKRARSLQTAYQALLSNEQAPLMVSAYTKGELAAIDAAKVAASTP